MRDQRRTGMCEDPECPRKGMPVMIKGQNPDTGFDECMSCYQRRRRRAQGYVAPDAVKLNKQIAKSRNKIEEGLLELGFSPAEAADTISEIADRCPALYRFIHGLGPSDDVDIPSGINVNNELGQEGDEFDGDTIDEVSVNDPPAPEPTPVDVDTKSDVNVSAGAGEVNAEADAPEPEQQKVDVDTAHDVNVNIPAVKGNEVRSQEEGEKVDVDAGHDVNVNSDPAVGTVGDQLMDAAKVLSSILAVMHEDALTSWDAESLNAMDSFADFTEEQLQNFLDEGVRQGKWIQVPESWEPAYATQEGYDEWHRRSDAEEAAKAAAEAEKEAKRKARREKRADAYARKKAAAA